MGNIITNTDETSGWPAEVQDAAVNAANNGADVKLRIDPEFFAYLPRLSEEDYAKFEAVLLEEGIRDPIMVWKGEASSSTA